MIAAIISHSSKLGVKYTNSQYTHLLLIDCRVVRGHTHRTTHARVLKVAQDATINDYRDYCSTPSCTHHAY